MLLRKEEIIAKTSHITTATIIITLSTLCGMVLPYTAFANISNSTTTTASPLIDPHDSTQVESHVRSYFADIPEMVVIAQCESGFRQFDSSKKVLFGGTNKGMVGVYQIYAKIHKKTADGMGFDIYTLDGNLAYARHLYEEGGTDPWLSSLPCWSNATIGSATSTTLAVHSLSPLNKNLKLGSKHTEVMLLQRYLNLSGFTVALSGPGSAQNETTTFGPMTREAVRKFQCAQNIVCDGNESSTGYGLVGVRTRVALLSYSEHILSASAKTSSALVSFVQPTNTPLMNETN